MVAGLSPHRVASWSLVRYGSVIACTVRGSSDRQWPALANAAMVDSRQAVQRGGATTLAEFTRNQSVLQEASPLGHSHSGGLLRKVSVISEWIIFVGGCC
jgi:hypothetical protein